MLLVRGPPGIGKTTLLRAAAGIAAGHGMLRLSARGGELERDFPYGLVRQLLEPRLAAMAEDERDALLQGAAALAGPAVGLAPPAAPTAGGDAGFATVHGLYWLCANLAQRAPLLIEIDDLHWGDAASIRFLAYLGRRVGELPVALVAALRPPSTPPQAELIEALGRDPLVGQLAPRPLSAAAVGQLAAAALGARPDAGFAAACHRAVAGNPFLAVTLLGALAEEGVAPAAGNAAVVERRAAQAVSTVVVGRLGRLPDAATALTRAVAVLGTDAELRLAAQLAGLALHDAAAAADALAAQQILGPGAPLEFVHPLVRAAVREAIPARERALAHTAAARLLAQERAAPERVATHLLSAEPAADDWAVAALAAGARAASRRGAPDAAVAYLRRALAEPATPGARPELLAELGSALLRAGEAAGIEHLRDAFATAAPGTGRAAIGRRLAIALVPPGHYGEAVDVLEQAAGDVAGDLELTLTLAAEATTIGRLDRAAFLRTSARFDGLPDDVEGTTPGERLLLGSLAMRATVEGRGADEAAALAIRALGDGALLREQTSDSHGFYDPTFALVAAERFELAEGACAAALADARERGSRLGVGRASAFLALLAYRRGALRDAEAHAQASIEAAGAAGWIVGRMATAFMVEALIDSGELDRARAALVNADAAGDVPDTFMLNFLLFARGRLRLAAGELAAGLTDLAELARREQHWRGANPAWFAHRSESAVALARLQRRPEAVAAADEELAMARRWGSPRAVGIALRARGLVEPGDAGTARLREAVDVLAASGARLEHARALVDLGAALRRSGERAASREPLRTGMDGAHRCDARTLAERARQELLATGARPRRLLVSGRDALTATERRVAQMAAAGMTNREIAQALFVTLRTVELHLTHAYRKLDIASRDRLAVALAD